MVFTLQVFLYIYYAFLIAWALFSLAGVYHMLRWGFKNITTFLVTFIFLAFSFLMISVSFGFIANINWGVEISAFGNLFTNNLDL